MKSNLSPEDIEAISRTIKLIENDAWDSDRRLADSIRSWLKGAL